MQCTLSLYSVLKCPISFASFCHLCFYTKNINKSFAVGNILHVLHAELHLYKKIKMIKDVFLEHRMIGEPFLPLFRSSTSTIAVLRWFRDAIFEKNHR